MSQHYRIRITLRRETSVPVVMLLMIMDAWCWNVRCTRRAGACSLALAPEADVKCEGDVKVGMMLDVALVQLCGKKMSDMAIYHQLRASLG